ncbi:hypothetical protein [Halobacillus sp. H74]|uniref:hypothetical protein n=1 Tax=Halobacillus sp. H74 TaxID=3457436 RepID=UPI003FCCE2CC
MAFGVKRAELDAWKERVKAGEIAILTHFWLDERFPGCDTVTKVGCADLDKLEKWGDKHSLEAAWIHRDPYHPHFDLFGDRQYEILVKENCWNHIERFRLDKK